MAAGEADGEQLAALERPVAGAHAHVAPPEPESGAAAPAQIAAVPEATAVGRGLTVTRALPAAVPAQPASETAVTPYVVVAAGLTERVAGEAATPFCVTPSDQVMLHGPIPVSAAEIVVAPPAQSPRLRKPSRSAGRGRSPSWCRRPTCTRWWSP